MHVLREPVRRPVRPLRRAGRCDEIAKGFTLVEMLAVVVLMSLVVGMTVVGLDGLSDQRRVQSALGTLAAMDSLARTAALTEGRPRLLCFEIGSNRCVIKRPEFTEEGYAWSAGSPMRLSNRIGIRQVLVESETEAGERDEARVDVCIRADGTSATYAVVVGASVQSPAAVVIDGRTGAATYRFGLDKQQIDESILLERRGLCDGSPN